MNCRIAHFAVQSCPRRLATALLFICLFSSAPVVAQQSPPIDQMPEAIRALIPSVVSVTQTDRRGDSIQRNTQVGVVFDPRGYILTLALKEEYEDEPIQTTVLFSDQKQAAARVVEVNRGFGLAILKVGVSKPLPAISLKNVLEPKYRATVFAVTFQPQPKPIKGRIGSIGVSAGNDAPKYLFEGKFRVPAGEAGSLIVAEDGEPIGLCSDLRLDHPPCYAISLKPALDFINNMMKQEEEDERKEKASKTRTSEKPATDVKMPDISGVSEHRSDLTEVTRKPIDALTNASERTKTDDSSKPTASGTEVATEVPNIAGVWVFDGEFKKVADGPNVEYERVAPDFTLILRTTDSSADFTLQHLYVVKSLREEKPIPEDHRAKPIRLKWSAKSKSFEVLCEDDNLLIFGPFIGECLNDGRLRIASKLNSFQKKRLAKDMEIPLAFVEQLCNITLKRDMAEIDDATQILIETATKEAASVKTKASDKSKSANPETEATIPDVAGMWSITSPANDFGPALVTRVHDNVSEFEYAEVNALHDDVRRGRMRWDPAQQRFDVTGAFLGGEFREAISSAFPFSLTLDTVGKRGRLACNVTPNQIDEIVNGILEKQYQAGKTEPAIRAAVKVEVVMELLSAIRQVWTRASIRPPTTQVTKMPDISGDWTYSLLPELPYQFREGVPGEACLGPIVLFETYSIQWADDQKSGFLVKPRLKTPLPADAEPTYVQYVEPIRLNWVPELSMFEAVKNNPDDPNIYSTTMFGYMNEGKVRLTFELVKPNELRVSAILNQEDIDSLAKSSETSEATVVSLFDQKWIKSPPPPTPVRPPRTNKAPDPGGGPPAPSSDPNAVEPVGEPARRLEVGHRQSLTPAAKKLVEQLTIQESSAAVEAESIRQLQSNGQAEQNKAAIAERQRKLTSLLSTAFDLKLQLEELQIKELQSRLSNLERQIGQRKALRNKIIARRATELINGDATKWKPMPTRQPPAVWREDLTLPDQVRPEPSGFDQAVAPTDAPPAPPPDSRPQTVPSSSTAAKVSTLMVKFVNENAEGKPGGPHDDFDFDRIRLTGKSRPYAENGVPNYSSESTTCVFRDVQSGHYVLEVALKDGQHMKRKLVVRNDQPRELEVVCPRPLKEATLLVTVPPFPKELLRESSGKEREPALTLRIRAEERQVGGNTWHVKESNDISILFDRVTGKPDYIMEDVEESGDAIVSTVKADLKELNDEDRLIFINAGSVRIEWIAKYTGKLSQFGPGWEVEEAVIYPRKDSEIKFDRTVEPGENRWQLEYPKEFLDEARRVVEKLNGAKPKPE